MTDYERETYSLLNQGMTPDAAVEALLGVAYELRTANLLALDHTLWLMQQKDEFVDNDEIVIEVQTQIAGRLGLPTEPAPKETTP